MVRLTKAQRKQRERIEAWIEQKPFKENARDKDPQVPELTPEEIMDQYVPKEISDGGKFYTPLEMAHDLWDKALNGGYIELLPEMLILEPCAGIGNLLYPIRDFLLGSTIHVRAYELDREACRIGEGISGDEVHWIRDNPFGEMHLLQNRYDLVVMNPPINIKWATGQGLEMAQSGAEKSEHLFLELAVRSLKPGGKALIIGPYNYFTRLPKGKGVRAWFDENAFLVMDFGKLPGEFQFSNIMVHGFIIQKVAEESKEELIDFEDETDAPDEPPEVIRKGGSRPVTEPIVKEVAEQIEFALLPEEPPEPILEETWPVESVLDAIGTFNPPKEPDINFERSIRTWGVREAITLTQDTNGNMKLREGTRRLRAAVKVGLEEIKVKVYSINDLHGAALSIDSNIQRSSNPIAEYQAILEFIEEASKRDVTVTEKDIYYATGMPIATIRKRMKLGSLNPKLMTAVAEQKIAPSVAEEVAKLSESKQVDLIKVLDEKGKVIGKDIKEVKLVETTRAAAEIPSAVFETPDFDPKHIHAFTLKIEHSFAEPEITGLCVCGRTVDVTEIEVILNREVN